MEEENGTFVKKEEKEFKRFYWFSKWFVTNRELLKKIGYGIFIGIDAVLLLFVLWTFLDAYVISYTKERNAVVQMVSLGQSDLRSYTVATAADDLAPGNVTILSLGDGEYDFYGTLSNPNGDWWAQYEYVISTSEGETSVATGFILPNEEKPIAAFGFEADKVPRTGKIELTNVSWHRVDAHDVGDYAEWSGDRLKFEIEDAKWTIDTALDDPIGRASFTVTNDTAFSYFDVVFYSLLLRGSRVVGVNRTTISSLDSFETQEVVINWFGTLPGVNKVEIIPEVNIFNVDIYKALEGESTLDTRTRVFSRRR